MKKFYYFIPLFLFSIFLPLSAKAYVLKNSDFIYIAKDEIIEGNLYFMANSLTVEGQVLGDLIGIASNIQINGQVEGDLITASQNINIDGQIKGNARLLSNALNIGGEINKNLNFLGENLLLKEGGVLGKDLLLFSSKAELNGEIKDNLHGNAQNLVLRGQVGGNFNLNLDPKKKSKYSSSLVLDEGALISGNLSYRGGNEALLKGDNVLGEVIKKDPKSTKNQQGKINRLIFSVLSSFLIAALFLRLSKNKTDFLQKIIVEKKQKLLWPGLIITFLTPLALGLLALTIIAIPLSIILFLIWGIFLYLSKIIVALWGANYIFALLKKEDLNPYLKVLSGIIILQLLFALPYLGALLSLASILLGMSLFYYLFKDKNYVN